MGAKEIVQRVIDEIKWARVKDVVGEPEKSKHVLVIPAYRETPEEVSEMLATIDDDSVLVLLMINESHRSSIAAFHENEELYEALAQHERTKSGKMLVLHGMVHAMAGVGGARHFGATIARNFQKEGIVESPWIHASDSDSRFPPSCFEHVHSLWKPDSALAIHALGHYGDDQESRQAASIINSCLNLSLLAIQEAGSPYAITPSGIGVAISAGAHDAVGGWPLYSMAEDLYMIKRSAKYGRVHRIYDRQVLTSSRPVSRAVARPEKDEETAGHGDMIRGIVNKIRELGVGEVVATAPLVWKGFRSIYVVINGILDGRIDCNSDLEKAFADSAVEHGIDPKIVLETIVDTVPLLLLRARATRTQFWHTFDMKAQGDVADRLCMDIERTPVETCVNDSPWGVKHEGDWLVTEQKLRKLVIEKCTGDVGNFER